MARPTIAGKELTSYVVSQAEKGEQCGQCERPATTQITLNFNYGDKLVLRFCKGHTIILSGYLSYWNSNKS